MFTLTFSIDYILDSISAYTGINVSLYKQMESNLPTNVYKFVKSAARS